MKITKTKAQKQALFSKSPQTQREKSMQDSLAEEGPARQAPRERGGSGAGTVRRKVRNQGGRSSQGGRQVFTSTCELSDRRAAVSQWTGNPASGSRRSTPKEAPSSRVFRGPPAPQGDLQAGEGGENPRALSWAQPQESGRRLGEQLFPTCLSVTPPCAPGVWKPICKVICRCWDTRPSQSCCLGSEDNLKAPSLMCLKPGVDNQ